MKIKLDENLPQELAGLLRQLGHEADSVADEGLTGRADSAVWAAAQRAGRFLITQDLDFSDVRRFRPGTHPGLMLVRLREPGYLALLARLRAVFATADFARWGGCLVVVSDHKVRVRRPVATAP